ncbi:signal transduction histidine kinase [Nocardioides sp. J9]|uniref:sensor histidine kinase n=1 Tax=unclassified Nocardioides TaxID=2615069 RepID=UPI0004B9CB5F|nr:MULTISPECIES: sensor histidine kinase [unclassified Nocardioides]TWG95601.1 signal transduction histidine kinase [Nocardioides sp. J9]
MARQLRQPLRLGPRAERWFDVTLVVLLLLPVPLVLVLVDVLDGVLMTAQITPLLWRRRHPVEVFVVIAAATGLQALLVDYPLWSQLAFPVATYSVARHASALPAAGALLVGVVGAGVAAVDWLTNFDDQAITWQNFTAYFVPVALFVVVAWALGTLARTQQAYVDALVERGERLEREAAQQAALAAVEERHRIAREMHDVVAHSLTTIVVQADGAGAAARQDPAVAVPALGTIAATGREAIAELRRMLGVLRAEDTGVTAPQPRLSDLPALLAEARDAGTPVEWSLPDPAPAVPDGVALTAYRIVQEALSNVRKHAGPDARARVEVREDGPELVVEVHDDGRGAAATDDGRGLGLAGMQERVAAHGGSLAIGPVAGGGFRVCARIPR